MPRDEEKVAQILIKNKKMLVQFIESFQNDRGNLTLKT